MAISSINSYLSASGLNFRSGTTGAASFLLDPSSDKVNLSGNFNLGTGSFTIEGNAIVTGASAIDSDTLQTVTNRGNTTTTSIFVEGQYLSGVTGLFSERVGIGTDSPNADLEVRGGNIDLNQLIRFRNVGGSANVAYLQTSAGDLNLEVIAGDLLLTPSANVGIGTTGPQQKLHVEFSNTDTAFAGGSDGDWGSEGIRIENTSSTTDTMAMLHLRNGDADIHVAGIRQAANDNDLGFFFEGDEKVRITSAGNVGIGLTNPAYELDVNGTIHGTSGNFETAITINGNPVLTGVTDANTYVTSASFNTSDGVLTLTRNDSATVTADLDGKYQDEITSSTRLSATLIGANGDVSNTEYGYLNGVTSAIQTQLNAKQATLTFGIADTNAVKIDSASVADNDYTKFTANGLEGRSFSEVKTDLSLSNVENTALSTWAGSSNITTVGTISAGTWQGTAIASGYIATAATWNGKQDALTFGIANTNTVKIDSASVADNEFARFTADGLESRSASEVRSDLSLGSLALLSAVDADSVTLSNVEVDNFKASAIVTEAEGIGSNDNDTSLPTSAAVKDYVDNTVIPDTNTFVTGASFNTSDGVLTLSRNDSSTVTTDLDGKYQDEITSSTRLNANLIGANGDVSNTEYGYLNGVTSAIQTQLNGKQATLTFGIGASNVLRSNGTMADNEFLKVDGTQIEGRSSSELKSDLSLNNVENTALSTWAGSSNITTVGTISAGTWQGTAIASGYIADAATWNGKQDEITSSARLSATLIGANGNVSNTEYGYLNGVTSAIQTQLDSKQATLTFGIADTNAVKIDSASVADNEYARFTANGLESRSTSEVLSDIGAGTGSVGSLADLGVTATSTELNYVDGVTSAIQTQLDSKQATLTFGIANTNAVKIDSASVADNEFARFTADGLESRSASEVRSDLSLGSLATLSAVDADSVTLSNVEVDNFKASAIVTEAEGIGSNDNDTSLPTSAAVIDYVANTIIPDTNTFVTGASFNTSDGVLTLTRNDSATVTADLDGKYQDEITSSTRLSATLIGANGNVSNTEYGYLNGVTSAVQTQLDAKQATLTFGIGTSNVLRSNGTMADNEFLKVDGTQIEGRSSAELKSDLSLDNVENTALSTWAGSSNITTVGTISAGTWQGTAIASGYIADAATWNSKQDEITSSARLSATLIGANGNVSNTEYGYLNGVTSAIQTQLDSKQATLTFGIANTNAVKIDSASVADNDYTKFTANGLEGRSFSEVKTDLSLSNVENTALSTWAGSSNITTVGTISAGTWQGTAIADGYISSASTWNAKQAALTFGIANTNAVKIDSASVADNEYARFTANGLESRSTSEVLSDIGAGTGSVGSLADLGVTATSTELNYVDGVTSAIQTQLGAKQATLTFGIANTNAVKIDSASVADNEFARFTANGLESRSASEVRSDLSLGSLATLSAVDADSVTLSNVEVDNFKASAIVTEAEGIGSNDNDTSLPTSAAVIDYVANTIIPDTNTFVTGASFNTSDGVLTLTRNDSATVTADLDGKYQNEITSSTRLSATLIGANGNVSNTEYGYLNGVTSAIQTQLNAKQATLTFGISDDNAVQIDSASVADNDYAKFTSNGLEGRSSTEAKSDLSLNNVENTALSTWAGSSNITTVGTISAGTWQGTAIADGYISSASTWNAKQAALTFGIANTNAVKIDSASVADNEYARFTANGLESRSTSEVLSDIGAGTGSVGSLADLGVTATSTELNYVDGVTSAIQTQLDSKQATLTFGIGTSNVLRSNGTMADNEFLKVDGTQIEGRSSAEVKSDLSLNNVENTALSTWAGSSNIATVGTISAGTWQGTAIADGYISSASTWNAKQAALTFGIANTNAVKIDSASVADNEYARFTANGLESRSASEVRSDLSLGSLATLSAIDADSVTVSNLEIDNFKASAIVTEAEGIASNDNDTTVPTSAAVIDYVVNTIIPDTNTYVTAASFNTSDGVLTLTRNDAGTVTADLDGKYQDQITSSSRLNANLIGANGNVSNTEYGYLNGVTSAIQTQLGAKQATLTFGISDDNTVQIDSASVADNDYAKFTANGLEGRSFTEIKSDLSLSNVENTALSTWGGSSNITTVGTISAGTWQGTAIADGYISSASTWNAKQAALTFGIANTNAVKIDSASVADNEYARFTANGLESRSTSEVLSDIGAGTGSVGSLADLGVTATSTELNYVDGVTSAIQTQLGAKQATLTFGIANTNAVKIDSASVADNDYTKFTANGLEGRSFSEVKSDLSLNSVENTALSTWAGSSNVTTVGTISAGTWQGTAIADGYISSASTWNAKQAALTFGIANTNAVKIDSASVADNEFARFTANGLESRSTSEVRSDLSLGSLATLSAVDADSVTLSNVEVDNFKASAIVTEAEGIGSNDNDTSLPTSAAVIDYVANTIIPDTNTYVTAASFNTSDGVLTLTRNDAGTVTADLDGKYQDEITSSARLSATLIGANGNVSNTEYGYLNGVTSAIQTQLDSKQATLTFGIANTNAVKIDSASVADNDYTKFTANGLEGRSFSEVKTDLSLSNVENTALSTWAGSSNITTVGTISAGTWQGTAIADGYISSASTWNAKQAALTFGIANTNAVKIDSASVADNEYARFTANGLESRSTSEVLSDIGAGTGSVGSLADLGVTATSTELNYVDGVTSAIQTQLGAKQATLTFGIANTNAVKIDSASAADNDYAKFTANGLEGRSFAEAKTDLSLNNVENTALSTWVGTSNITTVGTIGAGTWQGTAIADGYISSASTWNAKQAALTFGIANTNAVKIDSASVADNEFARFTANGLESRSTSEVLSDIGAGTGSVGSLADLGVTATSTELNYVDGVTSAIQTQLGAKQATLTFGIANTNAVKIDSASVADNDYTKFTANGLEGRSFSEVKSDLSLNNVENTALSTWAGSSNITTVGTISAALNVAGTVQTQVYAIGSLPSASPAGQRAFVNNNYYAFGSYTVGSTVYAGGSAFAPVYSDGSYWRLG